jgi:calcineurin-like phosphoesterase
VINAMGRTFMGPQVDNPFLLIEGEIEKLKRETPHVLIDFHAEATSEKIALGRAVDGLATLVVGTHTHVQTADDQIFPGGTAYLSDAGFCGSHESIIGRDIASVLQKYRTLLPNKFYIAREGLQADGVFVEAEEATGRAIRIDRFQEKVKVGD